MQLSSTEEEPRGTTLDPDTQQVVTGTQGAIVILHIPNEGILTMGAASIVLAAGFPPAFTEEGMTLRVALVEPIGQLRLAPSTTSFGIVPLHFIK